ncbi:MAG: cobalamin synthesis protein P47K [Kiritimatiellae bacterium]|nr:cobalamin synthesis protein P47K [Kiritimatiellia bacterium]MBP5321983.1 cobalamin synthesis protein P47K [Kiritimatiellia bacterium]
MSQVQLILAGGFLGAGKTTLIERTAKQLMAQGKRVGLITNDQAPELVDSQMLRQGQLAVAEVAGSCFCCNFNGFIDAIKKIDADVKADVILAEPVGSCADLSATIVQPLKKFWKAEVSVSPLTVLADPAKLNAILNGENAGLHEDAAYIYRKQLEESDLILISKSDTLTPEALESLKAETAKAFPASRVMAVSALKDEGIDAWLADLAEHTDAGTHLLNIDYDRYAHGEAVLGWLNGTITLHGAETDGNALLLALMNGLQKRIEAQSLRVGHVKTIVENGPRYAIGNITGTSGTLTFRGDAGTGQGLRITVNARVECAPEQLNQLVKETLDEALRGCGDAEVVAWRYLQPGRPNPTHRFAEVVA